MKKYTRILIKSIIISSSIYSWPRQRGLIVVKDLYTPCFRSGECNGRGRLECGACDCFQGYSGLMCECMGNMDNGDLNACKQVLQFKYLTSKKNFCKYHVKKVRLHFLQFSKPGSSSKFASTFFVGWVVKLEACPLTTAVLWVWIQTSFKNHN